MSFLQDKINSIMAYFDTEDIVEEEMAELPDYEEELQPVPVSEPKGSAHLQEERRPSMPNTRNSVPSAPRETVTYARSHHTSAETTVIDIKFPRKYEEAREIVNLLLQDVSVLIDFQHMTDSQARRCIDYLDGARFVLNGNLKKISSTMFLLTPVNVVVNIEDMGLRGEAQDTNYDFDMKRR
ncbi:cell division inhibitor SepF [Streptococcus rupicaprae]|uniref:Cell division protein SepF n=1 Tax=Streptococcus rupicaprae TaxID=759619 RepID=A0ABV2FIE2_9STRE